jgi:hypothetical protein
MAEELDPTSKLNDIEYFYNVLIVNSSGEKKVALTQDAIKLLVIEDNVEEPFASGYIVVDNNNNALQRRYKVDGEEVEEKFDFNLSDKDYLYVEVVPKMHPKQKKNDINGKVWHLKYVFTIYDIEDYDSEDILGNLKKLYLMDFQKYELINTTSNFSTALLQKSEIPQYLRDDEDRTEYTGNCIKEIIKGAISTPVFDNDWDKGSNKVFYTSPANANYFDDLEYLYSIHQSDVANDFCILSKQRYTEKWCLESFESIVSKSLNQNQKTMSGESLMEAFTLADTADMPKIPKRSRVPTDYGISRNVSFGDLSKIEKFRMFDVSRLDISEEINTKIGYSYNFTDGKFKIEHHDISDIKKFYDEKYVGKLASKKSLLNLTKKQVENKKVEYSYGCTYQSDNTFEFLTRNDVLKSQYILGVGIEFSLTGMTNRQAGKFFSIRKDHNYYDNNYEGKLQGVWFCTSVTHIFTGTSYSNDMVGVKLNLS